MHIAWFVLVGSVLIVMAFSGHLVKRLPLSPAIIYLGVGALIGPLGGSLLQVSPERSTPAVELLTEVAVLITLFTVGLRLRVPFSWAAWAVPLRLATGGMVITTAGIAMLGWLLLDLPWQAALLLGAILSPTDPVLASEVQLRHPGDRDNLRFSLTAEGGLNDGTAFPGVMLALGLMGLHEVGEWGWRWLAVDVMWAISAGLVLGWACGHMVGRAVHRLRQSGHPLEAEEFLAFGMIALVYGAALLIQAYGFLAVFAAGASLSHCERSLRADKTSHPDGAHSSRLIHFSAQSEHLAEVAVVLVIGASLASISWDWVTVAFALLVMTVARPLSVLATVPRRLLPGHQRALVAWFGIRGVGSVYYLAYAIDHGVDGAVARTLTSAVMIAITLSIVAHGISATPLMARYMRRRTMEESEEDPLS
ncbi:MAG: sodium:proton antiporter [Rubrivivax sp.]|nr:MAG: sodium:proton antiporter [Rubrivivax sp.]